MDSVRKLGIEVYVEESSEVATAMVEMDHWLAVCLACCCVQYVYGCVGATGPAALSVPFVSALCPAFVSRPNQGFWVTALGNRLGLVLFRMWARCLKSLSARFPAPTGSSTADAPFSNAAFLKNPEGPSDPNSKHGSRGKLVELLRLAREQVESVPVPEQNLCSVVIWDHPEQYPPPQQKQETRCDAGY